jgi:SAM-dependent methyltransferase
MTEDAIVLDACPVCLSPKLVVLEPEHDFHSFTTTGDEFTFRIGSSGCLDCGFIFLNPRAGQSHMQRYYERQSRIPRALDRLAAPYAELLDMQAAFIRRVWPATGPQRILDVGGAEGHFLRRLRSEVAGPVTLEVVEPSTVYADAARALLPGVTIHQCMLEDAPLASGVFDLITMRHVLEHMQSPRQALAILRPLLAPTGLLHIEVPNIADWPASVSSMFHHEHLSYFMSDSLRCVLELEGFRAELIEPWNGNPASSGFAYPVLRVVASAGEYRSRSCATVCDIRDLYQRHVESRNAYLADRFEPLRARVAALSAAGRRLGLFGAGPHTLDVLSVLKMPAATWSVVFDNNPNKAGLHLRGIEIARPTREGVAAVDAVLISSAEYEREMVAQLESYAVPELEILTLY